MIQMTDDEKFLFRGNSIEDLERMTKNNAREVCAAMGGWPDRCTPSPYPPPPMLPLRRLYWPPHYEGDARAVRAFSTCADNVRPRGLGIPWGTGLSGLSGRSIEFFSFFLFLQPSPGRGGGRLQPLLVRR